jgi:hypothetical protein
MTTLKTLSIVTALLAGGASLAMAQSGPATGGYPLWPAAQGAARLRPDQTFGYLLLRLIPQPDTREGCTWRQIAPIKVQS